MRTTIDRGGRVVIPKEIRDALGLTAGQSVDVGLIDGRISIDPTGAGMHLEVRDGLTVAVAVEDMPVLTRELVRGTLEQLRR